jgi:branched-chain amino acid transport system ATP-binding protein
LTDLLVVSGVSKRFGGLQAVQDVSLSVAPDSITALIGPNGAGKTTLFAIASGFLAPDRGSVRLAGRDLAGLPPHAVARLGMARTFQIVQPFANQTVLENIAVGAHLRHARRTAALDRAAAIGERVGLGAQLDKLAAALPIAGRKRLELARALATEPRLLLLDEVLAGLNPQEVTAMLPVLRDIRDGKAAAGEAGVPVTIFLIEHVMQAVMQLAEHIYVLANGALIAQGVPHAIARDERVIEAYLGHGTAARLRLEPTHG